MEETDLIVIGAGVVGLAIARAAAQRGAEVMVLEQHDAFGTETSARNSEVIHAGMYYDPGSLKARLCVEGRRRLYPYLESRGIAHAKLDKLNVAYSDADEARLETIAAHARANGMTGQDALQPLTGAQAAALEPALRCRAALLSYPDSALNKNCR